MTAAQVSYVHGRSLPEEPKGGAAPSTFKCDDYFLLTDFFTYILHTSSAMAG